LIALEYCESVPVLHSVASVSALA